MKKIVNGLDTPMHNNVLKIDLRSLPPVEAVKILGVLRQVTQNLEKRGIPVHTREKTPVKSDVQLSMCFDDS